MNKEVLEIAIENIRPNRYQPRKDFGDDTIFELAQSIRENGLIQPIVVRQHKKGYEIVAGERRYRACQLAGLQQVPCILMEATDRESAELALIENIQRENLSAIEEAKAYQTILRNNGYTQEELAQKLGKAQSTIANKLRLLELSGKIQQAIIEKKITERHARALLNVDPSKRNRVLNRIISKDYTVKETEEYVQKLNGKAEGTAETKHKTKGFSRNQMVAVNTIRQAVEMCRKMGIELQVEETETDTDRRIIVKFPKEG